MKLTDLLKNIKYTGSADLNKEISDVTCDSRKVKKNSAFVCITGTGSDGHAFAGAAVEAGAALVVAERDTGFENQIIVEDSRAVFAQMCSNYFGNPSEKLKLIAMTGTNGKTTVTFLVKHILEACGKKTGLIGTIVNMVGDREIETGLTTPDAYSLQSLFSQMNEAGCEYCIMEVSSHALEQDRVKNLKFKTAGFTNLTQDHLDFHGTMENYYNAKRKLFDMCETAVVNEDDAHGAVIAKGKPCKEITYSVDCNSDFKAKNVCFHSEGVNFTLCTAEGEFEAFIPIPGKFSVYNALAALGVACSVGVPVETAVEALKTAKGVKGRAEVFPTGRDFTVIIDYAHTPDGLVNIISAMRAIAKGRIVTLFGCGGDRDPIKRPLMGEAAAELSDFVVVTSDNPRTEDPEKIIEDIMPGVLKFNTPHEVIVNRKEAIRFAVEHAQKDDIIILAGKGHETYQILGKTKIHFDEREVLAEILK